MNKKKVYRVDLKKLYRSQIIIKYTVVLEWHYCGTAIDINGDCDDSAVYFNKEKFWTDYWQDESAGQETNGVRLDRKFAMCWSEMISL